MSKSGELKMLKYGRSIDAPINFHHRTGDSAGNMLDLYAYAESAEEIYFGDMDELAREMYMKGFRAYLKKVFTEQERQFLMRLLFSKESPYQIGRALGVEYFAFLQGIQLKAFKNVKPLAKLAKITGWSGAETFTETIYKRLEQLNAGYALNEIIPQNAKIIKAHKQKLFNQRYRKEHLEEIRATEKAYKERHCEEVRAYKKAYRARHLEKIRAYNKAYKEQHPEKIRAWNKDYYDRHRGDILAKVKDYQEQHPEKKRAYKKAYSEEIRAYNKAYKEQHREEIRAYNKAYKEEHREEIKAYNEQHREEIRACQKAWEEKHRKERLAYQRAYRKRKKAEREAAKAVAAT